MATDNDSSGQKPQEWEGIGWAVAAALVSVLICWLIPEIVIVLHASRPARVSLAEATHGLGQLAAGNRFTNPASAYDPRLQQLMPGPAGWWAAVAWLVGLLGCSAAGFMRHLEPQISRERIGRRAYDWRGARPRSWARPRDLRKPASAARGFSLGKLDGRPIWADEEEHVLVVAPTRAGKTTRCVIPWLLEHPGPAIVTSTKRDVLDATREAREKLGRIWVFDPFNNDSCSWSPVTGCDSWAYALRQAQWLADASSDGTSEIARYWRGEAAKLMAPLLHAAALADLPTEHVLLWLDRQELRQPMNLLRDANAAAALAQIQSVEALDPRNRGTTYMSAGSILAAYRYPEVLAPRDIQLTAQRFIRSPADTLFLVAGERHQRLLGPLLASLLSSILHEAIETDQFARADLRLKLLLDEAANVAPLQDLPRMLSQIAGHGIRAATIWQSLAQMHERYGPAADTILANSASKLFLGPITDERTRDYVDGLLGEGAEEHQRHEHKASPARLQQLGGERAILSSGARLPALVSLDPYWRS